MYKKILTFLGVIVFAMTAPSFATESEKTEDEIYDTHLFPKVREAKLFTGIPNFEPQKSMAYLSDESQSSIRGIAESFRVLSNYLQIKAAHHIYDFDSSAPLTDGGQASSSSSAPSIQISKDQFTKGKLKFIDYNLLIEQLAEMLNACCYFLSHKDYGFFMEPFKETLEGLKNNHGQTDIQWCGVRLKNKEKYLLHAPTYFLITTDLKVPQRFLVSSSDTDKMPTLEKITAITVVTDETTGLYLTPVEKHLTKPKEKKECEVIFLSEKYKKYLEDLATAQKLFAFVTRSLKVKMNSESRGALGSNSLFSSIAKEIGLIPELYEEFKTMRHRRIFDYETPPVGTPLSKDNVYKLAVARMYEELEVASVLMTLENDFLEAFKELSKDKVKVWLKESGIIL